MSGDLGVSPPTVKKWIELLDRLFLVYLITPFSGKLARSIRKEPKVYFYDGAAAQGKAAGARLENLVANCLLKYCHWQRDRNGKNYVLHYFRDRDQREVDFVVALNRKPHWCIEVKSRETKPTRSLKYLHEKFKPLRSIQLVHELDEELDIDGIQVRPLASWLASLGDLVSK